jgi:peroxiredoxin
MDFDVVELPETDHPEVGDTAPDFTRPLVNEEYWSDTSLAELTDDGPIVLVFYPMDGAFPATYAWNEIRDREWGEYATVVGVSISSPYEHKQLIEERGMDYRLFSDPDAGVAERYGVEHDLDGMTGVTEHRPAVFLLDDERTVEYAWVAGEWPDFAPYDEIEERLERL